MQSAKREIRKLVVIIGPTASGKSALAIKLAKRFNGEIISADSRQVYRNLDIGTGKTTAKEMNGICHYLLNVASPKTRFTVTQYRKLALKAMEKIHRKNKTPFLVGGTGLYIQSVVDGLVIPEVKPDWLLRKKLEKESLKNLWLKLKKIDPRRAKAIDKNNRRRLIRALEIVIKTKKPVPFLKLFPLPYPVLQIGIKPNKQRFKKAVEKRFFQWLKLGFLSEVKKLRQFGLSWQKIEDFGLHYRQAALYLQKKMSRRSGFPGRQPPTGYPISRRQMTVDSLKELNNYAKRQMTWFKRDQRIQWIKTGREAVKLVKPFLSRPNF